MGLSELTALDADTLVVLERDDQRGGTAKLKKAYRVELAGVTPVPAGTPRPLVAKSPALDLIPALKAGGGVVADKPEGLAVVDGNSSVPTGSRRRGLVATWRGKTGPIQGRGPSTDSDHWLTTPSREARR